MILFLFFNSEGGIDTIWTAYVLTTEVVKPADWPREDYCMTMMGVFVGKFYQNSKGDQSGRSGFIYPLKEPYSNTVWRCLLFLFVFFFFTHNL